MQRLTAGGTHPAREKHWPRFFRDQRDGGKSCLNLRDSDTVVDGLWPVKTLLQFKNLKIFFSANTIYNGINLFGIY